MVVQKIKIPPSIFIKKNNFIKIKGASLGCPPVQLVGRQ